MLGHTDTCVLAKASMNSTPVLSQHCMDTPLSETTDTRLGSLHNTLFTVYTGTNN